MNTALLNKTQFPMSPAPIVGAGCVQQSRVCVTTCTARCTNHRPQTTNYRPQITNHRSQTTDHRPQTTDHKLQTTNHRSHTTDHNHKPQTTDHRRAGDKGDVRGLPPRVRVMSRIILCRAMPLSTTELGLSRDMASYMSLSINQKAMVLSPTKACKPEGLGFIDVRAGQRVEGE